MEKEKKLMISFKGNKYELHSQLKSICARYEKGMNETILEIIDKYLKEHND